MSSNLPNVQLGQQLACAGSVASDDSHHHLSCFFIAITEYKTRWCLCHGIAGSDKSVVVNEISRPTSVPRHLCRPWERVHISQH